MAATYRRSRRWILQGTLGLAGLGLLAGCGTLLPQAQQPMKLARIGLLALARTDDPARVRLTEALQQGLREHGWVEGQTIVIDYRSEEGRSDQLPALAAELVRLGPDVLVAAGGSPAVRAARDATRTIPIVVPFFGGDPVADGLAASLARPGGNVTGLSNIAPELSGKRLELLKEVVPGLSRVAVVWNATSPTAAAEWRETQAAAQVLTVRLLSLAVRGPDDFESAFEAAIGEAPDALITVLDPITFTYRTRIIDFAAKSRLPTLYGQREFADDGGLMVYGPNLRDMMRRAADYVDKILKGANPAELPIERPMRFDFIINLGTAQALGLTMPQSVLMQATEVIE
jgi:putative ABC transport system substrate-binding protein